MRRRTWILSVPVTVCVLGLTALQQPFLQPTSEQDADALLGGNGKGKGPQCKQELFCNPQQCEQLVCRGNAPCPSHPQCECAPIPGCTPAAP